MLADTLRRSGRTRKIRGQAVGPKVIDTSTSLYATLGSNQRKFDTTKNRVRWVVFWNGSSGTTDALEFWYTTDYGATWQEDVAGRLGFAGASSTHTPASSFFIDSDDFAHFVYKDRSNGYIYYRRGTPNISRTSWTWSAATIISTDYYDTIPDIVAHKEGSGWKAHIVWSHMSSSSGSYTTYTTEYEWEQTYHHGSYPTEQGSPGSENYEYDYAWSTSSTIAPSFASTKSFGHSHATLGYHSHTYTKVLSPTTTGQTRQVNPQTTYYSNYYNYARYRQVTITAAGVISVGNTVDIGGNYGQANKHTYPSIDFRHIGDGKTPAASPDLFVAWSSGATGTSRGIRFRKAAYANGVWTWATERLVDSARYIWDDYGDYWVNCLFDGTSVIIGGYLYGTTTTDVIWEMDATHVTPTIKYSGSRAVAFGSMTYDAERNVYLIGSQTLPQMIIVKYDRKLNNTSHTNRTLARAQAYFSAKRGYSGNRIEFVYTDNQNPPYAITFGGIK